MPGTAFSTSNWTGYDEQSVTNPGSALTDFTLLIDVSRFSSTWKSNVQSDGADIRVTKGDDTEIPYDLINWAYNAGAPTGWIRCKWSGTLAASGTQNVRVWAGYTGGTALPYDANETYGSDNAYNAAWEAYWPFDGDANDRTSNNHDLTNNGADTNTGGQVGDCFDFISTNSDHMVATFSDIAAPLTIMLWVKRDDVANRHRMVWLQEADNDPDGFLLYAHESNGPSYAALSTNATTAGIAQKGSDDTTNWGHYCGVERSATDREVYLDDTSVGTNTTSVTPGTISYVTIGANHVQSSNFLDGLLDDIQVHSADRSGDWLGEEYAQSSDQATFWGTWAWTAAGSGTSIPVFMHHYLQMRGA